MNKLFISFFLFFQLETLSAQNLGNFDFLLKNKTKIKVFYSLPEEINSNTRLIVIIHDENRNGKEFRDQWIQKANELNLVIISPEFLEEEFSGEFGFDYGNIFDQSHLKTNNSIYNNLNCLVNTTFSKFNLQSTSWGIYGYGAGANFVHRMVLHNPEINYRLAIAANSDRYLTLTSAEWPFGLKNSSISEKNLKQSLSKYLLVMLDRNDTLTKPKATLEAVHFDKLTVQGLNRLDRGRNFFKGSIRKAKELEVFLKWGMVEIPTQDDQSKAQQMVPYAAELFYERLR